MSERRTYAIACPKCGNDLNADLYESINVKADPDLKQQLMVNQINAVVCTKCQFSFRVDKPLLYSDPDRRLLIYWIPTREDAYEAGQETFAALLREMGTVLPDGVRAPDVHLVFTRTELVERIFMMEAGLNERIIEYIKFLIYSHNVRKLNPAAKALLFNSQDSTDDFLCFVVQDIATRKFESVVHYERKTYEAFSEMFSTGEKSADLLELFPGPYISARAHFLQERKTQDVHRD